MHGKNSVIVIGAFLLGFAAGRFSLVPYSVAHSHLEQWVLYILIFSVGIGIGANTEALSVVKSMHAKIVLVLAAVIVGTLMGTGLASLLLPGISLRQGLAIGGGFGYYSLSSVIISRLDGETLGLIALMSNLMREIVTLFLSGPFATLFGPLAPVVAGGATAMDTTLPVIARASGKEYAVIAVFSGMVLTVLVPFIVPLLLEI